MADRPRWMQFDFDDFCGDPNVRLCPLDTQGWYVHLLHAMTRMKPFGNLLVNGGEPTPQLLANLTGTPSQTCRKHLGILKSFKVLKQDDNGPWYSQRLVEDYRRYQESKAFGVKGAEVKRQGQGASPPSKPPLQPIEKNRKEIEEEREEEREVDPAPVRLFINHWCQKVGPLILDSETSCRLGDIYRNLEKELPDGAKPCLEILCAEIDELAKRPPSKRTVKYFEGMLWGKLNEE